MVKTRKIIEKTFIDRCTIIEKKEILNKDSSNTLKDVISYKDIPCRISYENKNKQPATIINNIAELNQIIKLFINPEIEINAGSKIIATQNKREIIYKNTGIPAYYDTHQEIILENFQDWS